MCREKKRVRDALMVFFVGALDRECNRSSSSEIVVGPHNAVMGLEAPPREPRYWDRGIWSMNRVLNPVCPERLFQRCSRSLILKDR